MSRKDSLRLFTAMLIGLLLVTGCSASDTRAAQAAVPPTPAASEVVVTDTTVTYDLAADEALVQRGEYLTDIGGCNDCHTAGFAEGRQIPPADRLLGMPVGYAGPWGTSYPANLRLKLRELSADRWIAMVRSRSGLPPMPWASLHAMTDEDLRAIHAYVTSLGAKGVPAPAPLPPGVEPTTPYISFAPVMPKNSARR